MNNLQYDSFYKFLVSLGIILISLPILALAFIVNSEPLLLTQVEFNGLSAFSLEILQFRHELYGFIMHWFPTISIVFPVLGLISIVAGGIKWYSIQVQLDEQIKSDTVMKTINAQNMSTSQIVDKAVAEVSDANAVDASESENTTQIKTHRDNLVKYMQIEELCYKKAIKKYSNKYYLKKNVRVGQHSYDFIAVSKNDNRDLLFEVKYWRKLPSTRLMTRLADQVFTAGVDYEKEAHRNFKSIIIIVTPRENIDKMKNYMVRQLEKSDIHWSAEIQHIAEEDLY